MKKALSILILVLYYCLIIISIDGFEEVGDGSVCFNNCNGHGSCLDYSCHCYVGYHGDDCGHTYVADESHIIPILGAGHLNLTKKMFPSAVLKSPRLLVGFSTYNCHRCIQIEPEYEKITDYLTTVNITFARANADDMKSIALEHGATELPALVYFSKQRSILYKGSHHADTVITYIKKQLLPPITTLKSSQEIDQFISYGQGNSSLSLSTVMIIGFFSSPQDLEEDEYEEFSDIAKDLQLSEDSYFGIVTSLPVIKEYKKNHIIDRTPSVMLVTEENIRHTINLDEFYGERIGLKEWIEKKSIPLVGKLTGNTYRLYEKLNMPMLLLFLDLTHEHLVTGSYTSGLVGGKSGNILNQILLDEFRLVAKEYSDRIVFVYVDGIIHQDQMRSLGLYGGAERLPSLAFNTRDNRKVPFPEELPINYDTLNQYCAEFLSGKLRSPQDSIELVQKALKATTPVNPKNKANRKAKKEAPKVTVGISEQFGDGRMGDEAIIQVRATNFHDIVMNEEKDVAIVFYSIGCESCSHFAVYYKRMAQRFKELQIDSLIIARMDVTEESPPTDFNILISDLPLFVVLPAGAKHPPYSYYSGVSKVQSMMKWIQQEVAIPFNLPNLPHLSDDLTELYKHQIREREEYLAEKRRKEKADMEYEDQKRKELEEKRKQKKKREQENEQELPRLHKQRQASLNTEF